VDFDLSDEHRAFRKVVREFAEAEIAPHAEEWDRTHEFPVDVVRKMGDLGLFGLPFPEEYGGGGGDFTSFCIAVEEISRVDQSMGITLEAGVTLGINPIVNYGTEEQKRRWLPDLLAGRTLAGFGLTEPDAGSDAGATRTKAVLDGDEWVINGSKAFITNSGTDITSLVTVTARTGPDEISTIIVPAGTPGFVVEPAYRKMGWRASDTHGLRFEDCRVPAGNLLGTRGGGFTSSSPPSTTGASPSGPWRSASSRPASTSPSPTLRIAPPSGSRSAPIRRSRSSAPTWPWPSRRPACSCTGRPG